MPDISQITLPSGSTYNIKDAAARNDIEEIKSTIGSGVRYIGVTTTPITDGSDVSPVVIGGSSVTPKSGDLVFYGDKEFIWDGSKWNEFGDLGSLKALAFKDSASGNFTPAGTVTQPTFAGDPTTISVTGTPSGSVSIAVGSGVANYAPSGSVSQPTFSGDSLTSTGTFRPYGSVSQPTFSGDSSTFTGSFTPSGSVSITEGEGAANYTPSGSVSAPTITVTPSTTTVNSIEAVGTLPSFGATVANENLSFTWNAGTLPTKGSNTTVATGIDSATATAPTFSGDGVELVAAFSGTSGTVSVTGTPSGTVSQPTFTGTEGSVSVSGTPSGTVSKPSFSGTGVELTGLFNGDSLSSTGSFTPSGTVSQPTFNGTQGVVTVS